MTANQIAYKNAVETERHNRATEALTKEQNLLTERTVDETRRHNIVYEGETGRHNVVTEGISADANTIAWMHNLAMDTEAQRHQRAVESETSRHNQAMEQENTRHNTQSEANEAVAAQGRQNQGMAALTQADTAQRKADSEIELNKSRSKQSDAQAGLNKAQTVGQYFNVVTGTERELRDIYTWAHDNKKDLAWDLFSIFHPSGD